MASAILSSTLYLQYLNDYIEILLKSPDRYIIEHLHEQYLDEIETSTRFILAQWHSEQIIDQQSSLYIENVGHLNRKLGLLSQISSLTEMQFQRIKTLLFNPETIQLLTIVLQSLIERDVRHDDQFLRYLSILIDAYAFTKDSKPSFQQLTQQAMQSKFYKQYLLESIISNIEPKHLFFIGAIGQLAESEHSTKFNPLYARFLQTFYGEKYVSTDPDLHYCTLGILAQLEVTYLVNDYTCISTLISVFLNENTKIFRRPILVLFNSVCIQSKTTACYLNTPEVIDILLRYVTKQTTGLIHMNACLLLGHIISENQLFKLRIGYKLTMKILDLLVDYQNERVHILYSLLSLCIHEEIQSILAQTYQLKELIELSHDYPIVNEIIWKLSFHPEIIEQLIERHDDFLQRLPNNDGILANIRMKNLSRTPRIDGIAFDITLVYSTKDQIIVEQIKEDLLKNHFRLGTVSNSLYVLLCISEDSKHDGSCQAAIRQALLECKKTILCIVQNPFRIDDWFGKLHIQEKNPLNIIESGIEKLSSAIRKDLHTDHQLPPVVKKKTPLTTSSEVTFTRSTPPSLPPITSPIIPKKIQTWTNREVLEWCGKNRLSPFAKILTHYDGRNLLSLAHVSRMNAPHTIINHLRNDCRKQGLRLSFVEFVRFQTALDELLRLEKSIARKQSISTMAHRYIYRKRTTYQTS